ncbi:hypothetical protein Tco_1166883 [Tanacetum coccineum]
MVPLIEHLSSENSPGEASTSGVLVTVDALTTLSTTFTQSVLVLVPPLSVADYRVIHAGPQIESPSSGGIVFEKEELETSPEPAAVLTAAAAKIHSVYQDLQVVSEL